MTATANILKAHSSPYVLRNEIIQEYLATKDGNTLYNYTKHIQHFFNYSEVKQIQNLSAEVFAKYKNFLIDKGYKCNTINTRLSALRDFFKWCAEWGYLPMNPTRSLRNVRIKDLSEIDQAQALGEEEITALFKETTKASKEEFGHRLLMLMMFNLGLRVSEVTNIKVRDIVLKSDQPHISILGKGSKKRVLGLNHVLQRELKQYLGLWGYDLHFDDFIFQTTYYKNGNKNTKAPTRQWAYKMLNKYAAKAGLETPLKTHTGRVTAINILFNNDVEIRDVANFAGHSNINTTKGYDRKDDSKNILTSNIIEIK